MEVFAETVPVKNDMHTKPLGHKSYGSIPHLPGSRRGTSDHGCHEGQYRICCVKARDKYDRIIVQEKLDGSNVSIANVNGEIFALTRAGWPATTSPFEQHHLFAMWVRNQYDRWGFIPKNHRVCGEWLALAHGTVYNLPHEPFVAFDIMEGMHRWPYDQVQALLLNQVVMPTTLHIGGPIPIDRAIELLGPAGFHGCVDGQPEGVVYRVECNGQVDFLAKYVRPDKEDGKYLPERSGKDAIWHWRPK